MLFRGAINSKLPLHIVLLCLLVPICGSGMISNSIAHLQSVALVMSTVARMAELVHVL
jgi:hypothetical protein